MYVVFKESIAVKAFENQDEVVAWWRENGGTIIYYPDLTIDSVIIH